MDRVGEMELAALRLAARPGDACGRVRAGAALGGIPPALCLGDLGGLVVADGASLGSGGLRVVGRINLPGSGASSAASLGHD